MFFPEAHYRSVQDIHLCHSLAFQIGQRNLSITPFFFTLYSIIQRTFMRSPQQLSRDFFGIHIFVAAVKFLEIIINRNPI
jgi:hypothetical protein